MKKIELNESEQKVVGALRGLIAIAAATWPRGSGELNVTFSAGGNSGSTYIYHGLMEKLLDAALAAEEK